MQTSSILLGLVLTIPLLRFLPERLNAAEDKAPDPRQFLAQELIPVDEKDRPVRRLLKARFNEQALELNERAAAFMAGKIDLDSLIRAIERALHARLGLTDRPVDHIAALKKHLEMAKKLEKTVEARFKHGTTPAMDLHRARGWRLDVELRLLGTKEKEVPK
jgi:hypothetical protein